MCVCVFAGKSQKSDVQTSPTFALILPVAMARSSCGDSDTLCRLLSVFEDDVMFVHSHPGKGNVNRKYFKVTH